MKKDLQPVFILTEQRHFAEVVKTFRSYARYSVSVAFRVRVLPFQQHLSVIC